MTTRPRRILVVANETIGGTGLIAAIEREANGGPAELLVVSPALNSRLRHWTSDEDDARRGAESRLATCVARLENDGFAAAGTLGDADPIQAIRDALCSFSADCILISTYPRARSRWLTRNVPERARAAFELPIVHVAAEEREEDVLLGASAA